MKPGASDPFADDDAADEAEAERADSAARDADPEESGTGDASDDAAATGASDGSDAPPELPYIYRRDRVKDERPDVHQLFVREDTDERARDAERDLEKLLGEDVYRLDAREAIYLAGMAHLDEAADVLREWGYDR